jgi:hypothetical protein
MLPLYNLPDWLMARTIVSTSVALCYAGYFAFHRVYRPSFSDDERSLAMTVLGAVATVNSLLLAFVAVSVWESFGSAETAVVDEANTVSELARDLAIFDSAESRAARHLLRQYAEEVVNTEWRDMQRGQANNQVWVTFDRLFVAVGTIEPETARHTALLPEVLARTNELLKLRRTRLHTSESAVPLTLWSVVLLGTLLTVACTFVLSPTRFNLWMIGMLATSIALVLHLIVAMDRPFAGEQSIGAEPFQTAIDNMQRWDKEVTKPAVVESSHGR